jgi:hypothetical protein
VVALVVVLLAPAVASADGDPASDVLLGENVFYPYSPPTSPAIQKQLNAVTTAAKRAHFPVKVALIGSPVDLGVIPSLFGKPQKYADFLDQEISFATKQPLLVVMASGYGVEGMDAKAQSAVSALGKPAGTQSNELGQAAITAVGKLAAASGHPLQGTTEGSDGRGTSKAVLVAILAAIAIAAAGSLIFVRRRYATR